MDATGWIILFCALITLAILAQAGALLGMFLQVRQVRRGLDEVKEQVNVRFNALADELQGQTRALSEKAHQTTDLVRQEMARLEDDLERVRALADETMQGLRDLGQKAKHTVRRLLYVVDPPARETGALSRGLREGLRAFFDARRNRPPFVRRSA